MNNNSGLWSKLNIIKVAESTASFVQDKTIIFEVTQPVQRLE